MTISKNKAWPSTELFSLCSIAQSYPTLCNPWTVPTRLPQYRGFSRQWNLCLLYLLHWQAGSLLQSHLGSPLFFFRICKNTFVFTYDGKKSPFPNPPPQAWKCKITVRCQYPSTREKWRVWSGQCSGSMWPQQLTKITPLHGAAPAVT